MNSTSFVALARINSSHPINPYRFADPILPHGSSAVVASLLHRTDNLSTPSPGRNLWKHTIYNCKPILPFSTRADRCFADEVLGV